MKLTLITIVFRGVRHVFARMLPVDHAGKAKISSEELSGLATEAGVKDGQTFSIGG